MPLDHIDGCSFEWDCAGLFSKADRMARNWTDSPRSTVSILLARKGPFVTWLPPHQVECPVMIAAAFRADYRE